MSVLPPVSAEEVTESGPNGDSPYTEASGFCCEAGIPAAMRELMKQAFSPSPGMKFSPIHPIKTACVFGRQSGGLRETCIVAG